MPYRVGLRSRPTSNREILVASFACFARVSYSASADGLQLDDLYRLSLQQRLVADFAAE